ncbi:hypothetical protein K8F61_17230 [Microbacterium resistens]|uniref:Formyl transferase N-terminal domain-containing protein n=1 Tax=Microbacterium resistens TaxID=156977 RepID=A0ABY3RV71_9MICO|nr:formyltransferase family protein [Microbacterium resistens]UGS26347.1 hypothetical protein K8F61_17230 [Microbacterium resistens]
MTSIYLAGSGSFGLAVAEALAGDGHALAGLCSPAEGRRGGRDVLATYGERTGIPWTDVRRLAPEHVPDGVGLILTAHSHAFVGRRTRACAPLALGYHPSLLPLHRGRDAVKWQARMHERVVGGTIYHLTDRVDGGPIALQRHLVVPPGLDASALWSRHLFPLGVELIREAAQLANVPQRVPVRPQDDKLATWEPSFDSAPVHRPELLELTAG